MSSRITQWRKINKSVIDLFTETDSTIETDKQQINVSDYRVLSEESIEQEVEGVEETDFDSDSNLDSAGVSDSSDSNSCFLNHGNFIDDKIINGNLREELAEWVVVNQTSHSATNQLLFILRKNGHTELPKDVRTLLKTPSNIPLKNKCGGDYIYYGLETNILKHLSKFPNLAKIELVVNVDGIPLFKSTSVALWPKLCSFSSIQPFAVAIFCGKSKPSSEESFMFDFVTELTNLLQNGIKTQYKHYLVSLKSFCCDAPARQFLKSIISHNGYDSCERCIIHGARINHRQIFLGSGYTLRNDTEFNLHGYKEHQKTLCTLAKYNIPCVTSFVLDIMHLVYLGVTKRIIIFFNEGKRSCRISEIQKAVISEKLRELSGKLPSEFARQPRGIDEFKRWKATEFKNFLLYTGMIVLKNVVSQEIYTHFLSLSVAMSIMIDNDLLNDHKLLMYAKGLLEWFVYRSSFLYGQEFVTYNVHSLTHLYEDVVNHSCSLQDISAFPFENYLGILKSYVRKAQSPLSQLTKRIEEIEKCCVTRSKQQSKTKISIGNKNRWFFIRGEKVVRVNNVIGNDIECYVYQISDLDGFFDDPCCSKLLHIYFLHKNVQFKKQFIKKDLIIKKVCGIPYNDGYVLVPLHHNYFSIINMSDFLIFNWYKKNIFIYTVIRSHFKKS
ncbi:uncharacterized protein LOC105845058 isoform X3 [Hydra vulgaris]|uniref:uncharacterized protein LOC105845058 isoform X3 n=1 Tax=Hydra vulgaris TaxID=6087 RepID=UPI0032EA21DB